jgi:hypothetical protein
MGSFLLRAKKLFKIATNAATAEMSATDMAIKPRFAHVIAVRGVKYRPTIRAGATAGTRRCLTNTFIVIHALEGITIQEIPEVVDYHHSLLTKTSISLFWWQRFGKFQTNMHPIG